MRNREAVGKIAHGKSYEQGLIGPEYVGYAYCAYMNKQDESCDGSVTTLSG